LALALTTGFAHLLTSPPGINADAARLAMYALDLLRRGVWPLYVFHQMAPCPLLIYLDAGAFWLLGPSLAVLRGVTAVLGAFSAPLAYLAAREILAGEGEVFAGRAGLIAGLGIALSPFLSNYNRNGIEPSLLPPLELLAVALLWRGLRLQQQGSTGWPAFLGCGAVLGLSQYAYIVARAFPLALAGALAVAALFAWRPRGDGHPATAPIQAGRCLPFARGLALAAAAMALVALPQWLLFLRFPHTFVARTEQSAGRSILGLEHPLPALLSKLVNQALMLGWHWDNGYDPFSGRPWLNPLLLLGLLLAIGWVLRRRRAAGWFLLSLAAALFLPDLLSFEGLAPAANRSLAAAPFVFMLAGLGLARLWGWLDEARARPDLVPGKARPGAGVLVLAAVLLAGLEGQWDLARRVLPATLQADGAEWRTGLVELAEGDYVAAHRDTAILLPASEYERPGLAFILARDYPERAGGVPLPLSPGDRVTLVQPLSPDRPTSDALPSGYLADEWVLLHGGTAYFLPPAPGAIQTSGAGLTLVAANGAAAATAYQAIWQAGSVAFEPTSFLFADGLALVGYRAGKLVPGQPFTATLLWQSQRRQRADLQVFVQLLDQDGKAVAGYLDWPLHGAYRAVAWRLGETVPESLSFAVAAGLAPGGYRLIAGVVDVVAQQRLRVDGGSYATLATLKVPLPPSGEKPATPTSARFGPAIGLSGYTLTVTGRELELRLFWRAEARPPEDYTVFVHVEDAAGKLVAQVDGPPVAGRYPTSLWDAGETVLDQRALALPPGQYTVYVGLYRWPGLQRLPLSLGGQPLKDDQLPLGTISVR